MPMVPSAFSQKLTSFLFVKQNWPQGCSFCPGGFVLSDHHPALPGTGLYRAHCPGLGSNGIILLSKMSRFGKPMVGLWPSC